MQLIQDMAGSRQYRVFTTDYATGSCEGSHEKLFWGAPPPQNTPNWWAAVVASEGQRLGSCPRSAKISMSSQDDLGQGSACSALAMDPFNRWKHGGRAPLASICLGSMANAEHAGP